MGINSNEAIEMLKKLFLSRHSLLSSICGAVYGTSGQVRFARDSTSSEFILFSPLLRLVLFHEILTGEAFVSKRFYFGVVEHRRDRVHVFFIQKSK
jgi:hypothetical protein